MGAVTSARSPRLLEWQARGRVMPWRRLRLYYRAEGEGPAVLLLHGYPTGSYDWHALWPLLQPSYRLVAPDFPGLGFSDKPPGLGYTLDLHAEAVDAVLDDLGRPPVHVVAHDLGVRVAQALLVRREADRTLASIGSLVLLNGAMCPEAYRPRFIQRLLASPIGPWLGPRIPRRAFDRTITGMFGASAPPSRELLDDFWALVEHGDGRRITHEVGRFWRTTPADRDRLVGALLRSSAPLRLVNGSADPNSGEAMVKRWLSLAPGTDTVRLARIGHWPQLEAPIASAAAIREFWTGRAQAAVAAIDRTARAGHQPQPQSSETYT